MIKPEACVLKTDGINCDAEMMHAFTVAGAAPELVHINQLRSGDRHLNDYGILAIPGGFSYGDDIVSGKILATELTSYMSDQLQQFVDKQKPIIAPCNGFQVLLRTGLLPDRQLGKQSFTLAENQVGRFECRWIDLAVGKSVCKFAQPGDFEDRPIPMQVAHGEGQFIGGNSALRQLITNQQVVFRYASPEGDEVTSYPDNPNGSLDNIAGICDPSGTILGLMPHPERSVAAFHPHRAKTEVARRAANVIFNNIVNYAKEL